MDTQRQKQNGYASWMRLMKEASGFGIPVSISPSFVNPIQTLLAHHSQKPTNTAIPRIL
jgi:hypothetical protein